MTARQAEAASPPLVAINDGRRISPIVMERAPLLCLAALAVIIPQFISIEQLPHNACLFFGLTGIPCPFCGLTRSLWAAADGRWLWSFTFAPLGGMVYLGALLFLAIVAVEIITGRRLFPALSNRLAGLAMLAALLLNWVVRLSAGLI